MRRAGLTLVAGATLLLVLVLRQPGWALVVKSLVDPLFHSTSIGATVALAALAIVGGLAIAVGVTPSLRVSRWLAAGLVTGIVLGNSANLGAHLVLLQQQGLPWQVAVYHWAGDTNTYSYLLHAHTGKAALHALLSGWGAPLAQGFDIGGGLVGSLPPVYGQACAVSLLLAVLCWAALLPAVARPVPPAARRGAPADRCAAVNWPAVLLFSFCALNALKSIADGGPLSYRFAPVLAVLLWMLPTVLCLGRGWRMLAARVGGLGLVCSGALSWWLAGPLVGDALGGAATTLCILSALLGWHWRSAMQPRQALADSGRQQWLRRGLLLVGCTGTAASVAISFLGGAGKLMLPLPDGMQATVCRTAEPCRQLPVHGQRAFDVYRAMGDDPLKPRHTLLADQAHNGATHLWLVVQPLHTASARPVAGNPVRVVAQQALPDGAGVLLTAHADDLPRVFLAAPGPFSAANYHVFLHLTAARLRAQGLAGFTLVPLRHPRDAQALGLQALLAAAPSVDADLRRQVHDTQR